MYRQRRHPSRLAQFILTAQLVVFAISNLALLALSFVAMAKTKRLPDTMYPDWAVYNYTISTAGVSSLVLVATFITTAYVWEQVSQGERHQIPWSLLTIKTTVLSVPAGSLVFKLTSIIILTGALFTGLSLAFEEPGVREYPNKEVTTRTPSTLQVL
ncbi:unnamed protein product [Clonostachys rosea f. rosea IK726]|uniref:Uncharacterized protein n=1 Tax=Clonostachys rosea f. rosea IK726 TaxID=1349383 RepID=A0ACA9TVF8_BIOOC|nr:unnamed protein product [Clonostachys rosea f. rosea IK726]